MSVMVVTQNTNYRHYRSGSRVRSGPDVKKTNLHERDSVVDGVDPVNGLLTPRHGLLRYEAVLWQAGLLGQEEQAIPEHKQKQTSITC